MKFRMYCILICAIAFCFYGCASRSAKLHIGTVPSDKTLFETGIRYMQERHYVKSRRAFQTLIIHYPDSDLAPDAVFALADTYYEEGGAENQLQAEDEYRNFMIFYPASPRAPEAQLKIIALNVRNVNPSDRDHRSAFKALREIEKFEKRFPESDLLPIVKRLKNDLVRRAHMKSM
jgi:outer membrane protein assembly factor BamD